jgi:exonuclease SbcC
LLAATEATLQQFRSLIKDAGPQVTRALLSQISQQANTIFGDIIGDRASMLSWENDYEIVLRRDGKTRSFAQLSGGEQMSAALAVRLALLRRLTRLDMAFFDEPTQNMDGERRSALAEQLRRVRGFEQLIVISHDDTFEQGLDSVIHLEKRDGATRVAEGEEVFAATTDMPLEENLRALAFG